MLFGRVEKNGNESAPTDFILTLIGMSYESKKNAHLQRHQGVSFTRLNELGRVSNYPD